MKSAPTSSALATPEDVELAIVVVDDGFVAPAAKVDCVVVALELWIWDDVEDVDVEEVSVGVGDVDVVLLAIELLVTEEVFSELWLAVQDTMEVWSVHVVSSVTVPDGVAVPTVA
jgi:hypothetical protein